MALTPEQVPFDENKDGKLTGSEMTNYTTQTIANAFSGSTSNNPKSGTSVDTSITKLTPESARALMETAAEASDYMGKFSSADVAQFMKEFDAEQKRQIEKVITTTDRNSVV